MRHRGRKVSNELKDWLDNLSEEELEKAKAILAKLPKPEEIQTFWRPLHQTLEGNREERRKQAQEIKRQQRKGR